MQRIGQNEVDTKVINSRCIEHSQLLMTGIENGVMFPWSEIKTKIASLQRTLHEWHLLFDSLRDQPESAFVVSKLSKNKVLLFLRRQTLESEFQNAKNDLDKNNEVVNKQRRNEVVKSIAFMVVLIAINLILIYTTHVTVLGAIAGAIALAGADVMLALHRVAAYADKLRYIYQNTIDIHNKYLASLLMIGLHGHQLVDGKFVRLDKGEKREQGADKKDLLKTLLIGFMDSCDFNLFKILDEPRGVDGLTVLTAVVQFSKSKEYRHIDEEIVAIVEEKALGSLQLRSR